MRTLFIVALLSWPNLAAAEDRWFAADKAKHFGAGAAISAGTYAVVVPLTARPRWRITVGTTTGIAAAAGKELRDRRRGGGSWRDFAWTAGGTASGVVIAWIVDKATD